jgi:SAM-dependent methyltransferase
MRPPEEIPQQMLEGYSMGGKVRIEYSYRDDSNADIQDIINKNYTEKVFKESYERIARGEWNYYGQTDYYLYEALNNYPIVDKDICVIGSTHPWYEIMCLNFGARSVTVIEYSERKSFHEKITYLQPHESLDMKFDSCLSISSFEHDGLGRYGDPLNPNGDLEAMQNMKDVLKPEGVMFLAVPVGVDTVWFNVHRIYGEHRFHELIKGWNVLDRYGFHALSFDLTINNGDSTTYQPVVVLENSEVS